MALTTRLLSFVFLGAVALATTACPSNPVQVCGTTGVVCPKGTHCAAAQGICISDVETCGDLNVDTGREICDDGNNMDGDGCSRDCQSNETCGNGKTDETVGEICDDGNTTNGDKCSSDCKSRETCGNGIKDVQEACDDGNNNDRDGCSQNCKSTESCGNNVVDSTIGEVCDPPKPADPDGRGACSADCRSVLECGNGDIDPGEECDDGLANNGNDKDCRADCVVNRCGDGHPNLNGPLHVEACDGGAPVNGGPAPENDRTAIPRETAGCNIDCTALRCGDRKTNATGGEECDDGDGNNTVNNNCTDTCDRNVCGDNKEKTQGPDPEECDDGNSNNDDGCSNACTDPFCGNNIVDQDEDCDDGNNVDTDGCTNACNFARCGDHITQTGVEQCDDGNTANDDGCSSVCRDEECGNGIVDLPDEECDNGTANNGNDKDCRADCVINRCGDGHINQNGAHREFCDDGRPGPGGTPAPVNDRTATPRETNLCNFDCTLAGCGDSKINRVRGEECDNGTGNNTPSNDCTDVCLKNVCGDNKKDTQAPVTEQCDDGGTANNDGCSSVCRVEECGNGIVDPTEECDNGLGNNGNDKDCRLDCVINRCGDGHINQNGAHVEACDAGRPGPGGTPAPARDRTAIPLEASTCNIDCTAPRCGDRKTNASAGEECDDGDGNNTVNNNCTDTCDRNVCGDNKEKTQGPDPEECDDGNSDNDDGCSNACTDPFCGNNIVDQGEDCDDGNTTDTDGCTNACNFARCGDNIIQTGVEECDEGDTDDDDGCSSTCRIEACGNQVVDIGEACDDGNQNACGACSNDCNAVSPPSVATGLIFAASSLALVNNETFRVSDGALSVTFTFVDGSAGPNQIGIGADTADDNAAIADQIANKINSSGLVIDAVRLPSSSIVQLTHRLATQIGNVAITETVVTPNFGVFGMIGGRAGNCAPDIGCTQDDDCESHNCSTTTGTCELCILNSDCESNRCVTTLPALGQCQPCRGNADCAPAHTCTSGVCVPNGP